MQLIGHLFYNKNIASLARRDNVVHLADKSTGPQGPCRLSLSVHYVNFVRLVRGVRNTASADGPIRRYPRRCERYREPEPPDYVSAWCHRPCRDGDRLRLRRWIPHSRHMVDLLWCIIHHPSFVPKVSLHVRPHCDLALPLHDLHF